MRGEQDFDQTVLAEEDSPWKWINIAKEYNVRLPLWRMPCTTGGMRRFLKKIGKDPTWYLEQTNEKSLREFAKVNPEWPLRAWAGLCLEWVKYERTADERRAAIEKKGEEAQESRAKRRTRSTPAEPS